VPDRLVWPDGTIYEIVRSTASTAGALLEMRWHLPAGGWAPQAHVHPNLSEDYEVLTGSLDLLQHGRWQKLAPGDAASIAPGTAHTFRVADGPAVVRNVHRPALDFEPYIRRLCAAANQHALGDLTGLRSLLQIAVLVYAFPRHSQAENAALNAAVPALAAIGRLLGYRANLG
jgi:mannose-6-phosphate isomerase-like protein (cupin superfamily)